MKYKVGDKVRIKSIDWYNENKDDYGYVWCTEFLFTPEHSKYCGRELTISHITEFEIPSYVMESNGHDWTAEMIECLVERNGKTYPYKIGDRVILKGYNRCATITDLKYNSWGNLSYYIKIDNDKDISIDYPTELLLPYDNMIEYVVEEETKPKFNVGDRVITDTNMKGKIIEVVEEGWYRVEFEPYNGIPQPNGVVPEENMSLVEEEIKPKFKVGDKITNGEITFTILRISSDRYGTEDTFGECGSVYFKSQDEWKIVEEEVGLVDSLSSRWVNEFNLPDGYIFKDENGNVINAQKIVLEKLVVPKFKKGDKIKDKNNRVWYVEQVGNKHFDISRIPNGGSGYFVPIEDQDYYELVPDRELPKTFEECVHVLEGENRMSLELMNTFRKLIDARNAYWTIAGEEMGLGKPWGPDWKNDEQFKYVIICRRNCVIKDTFTAKDVILAFPTPEMRNAFYENFKELINSCKELL